MKLMLFLWKGFCVVSVSVFIFVVCSFSVVLEIFLLVFLFLWVKVFVLEVDCYNVVFFIMDGVYNIELMVFYDIF